MNTRWFRFLLAVVLLFVSIYLHRQSMEQERKRELIAGEWRFRSAAYSVCQSPAAYFEHCEVTITLDHDGKCLAAEREDYFYQGLARSHSHLTCQTEAEGKLKRLAIFDGGVGLFKGELAFTKDDSLQIVHSDTTTTALIKISAKRETPTNEVAAELAVN